MLSSTPIHLKNQHGIAHVKARIAILAVAAVAALAAVIPSRAQEPTAAGLWQKLDEDTKKPIIWFLFVDRAGVFEGYAAKMFPEPGEDPNPACTKCTDDRKGMPLLGLPMIRGMKRNGLRYEGGTILDPRDGSVYKAVMTLEPAKGILVLRGYLGFEILGKNDIWHHVPDSNCAQLDKALLTKLKPVCAEAAKVAPKAKAKAPPPTK
jgi:uncharacterized protein (DUF2147 family)